MRGYELPCEARVADGAVRGAALGFLWSAWFGVSEVWCASRPLSHNGMQLAKSTGGYVLGFGGFLAVYNGIFCWCERQFGRDSSVSPVVSGALVGLGVGVALPPFRLTTVLQTSAMCASMCGICHQMGVGGWRTG